MVLVYIIMVCTENTLYAARRSGIVDSCHTLLLPGHRQNEDGNYTVVWKSDKIDNTLSPVWAAAKIPMHALCNGDVHRPLRIEIFDWDSNGKHQSMGAVSDFPLRLSLRGCGWYCWTERVVILFGGRLTPFQ